MKKCLTLLALVFIILSLNAQTCTTPFHIVILGSSTAYGNGASNITKSWAYMYAEYLKTIDSNYIVDNLAVAGTTTYSAQADNYVPPAGRPAPLLGHNITTAINLNADAIIINFPSNDIAQNFTLTEQEDNFKRITLKAEKNNILVWVATPQPRNTLTQAQITSQNKLYSWIINYYGAKAIDFHRGLASATDSILHKYDSGDGLHVNNEGHQILYNRVFKESIPDSLCNSTPPAVAQKIPAISEATY